MYGQVYAYWAVYILCLEVNKPKYLNNFHILQKNNENIALLRPLNFLEMKNQSIIWGSY